MHRSVIRFRVMQNFNYNAFHNYQSLTDQLTLLKENYPEWVELYSIGQSVEGRELWCMQIADSGSSVPLEFRPALLVTGNMHSVELAGSCQVLHFAQFLTAKFAKGEACSGKLKNQVWYLIPRISPDGTEKALENGTRNRSRWISARRNHCLTPEDMDGNGKILEMRWKSDAGRFRLSEKDSRIMVPRQTGDSGPFYEVALEGMVEDWDGSQIQRLPVLCDFNRNFPTQEWKAMPDWIGNGRYPLSEPETRAVADFVLARPHISRAVDFHTGNFAVFRPFATRPAGWAPGEDKQLCNEIGKIAEALTGWPYVTSYEEIKGRGPDVDGTFGTMKDWLYEGCGIPAYVPEMGMYYNYCGVGGKDLVLPQAEFIEKHNLALLEAHEREPDRKLFYEWTPFEHPQLGEVEIGGWDVIQWSNPPLPDGMEEACRKGTQFLAKLAEYQPEVEVSAEVEQIAPDMYRVTLQFINQGALSTSITEQGKSVYPDLYPIVEWDWEEGVVLIEGKQRTRLSHLSANGGWGRNHWIVSFPSRAEQNRLGTVRVTSLRGLYAELCIRLP